MTSIQKQIKKIDNAFTASMGKDIAQLRKQAMNHEYYTNIESYMSEKFKRIKKSRKIVKRQKFQQQYNSILMQANPFTQSSTGYMSNQFQYQMPMQNMFIPALQNIPSSNYDQQIQLMQQQSIVSLGNVPSLDQMNSQLSKQNPGMMIIQPNMQLQQQQQQIQIQHNISNGDYSSNISNYMKMDRVQQSVKKDLSRIVDNDDEDFDEDDLSSESDQRVYEQFSFTYTFMQNERRKDITIEHHDLKKLVPGQYLNDTIVNFFLKFLEIELLPDQMKEKVLIFNTYFMSKLAPNDQIEQMSSSSFEVINSLFEKNYQAVRRWIKEDIFDKEYLVFPLNLPEHWSVIIVCNHKNLFDPPQNEGDDTQKENNPNTIDVESDRDKMSDDNEERPRKDYNKPCLVYFDSFGLLDQKYSNMIRLYLNKEYETKKKSTVQKDIIYDEKTLPSHQPLIPRQTNYVDCGLYLLEYVENFLNNPQKILSLFNSSQCDEWMNLRWFPRCNIHRKRKFIKELAVDLSKLTKEEAVQNYSQKRSKLIEQKKDNESQYDEIDMDEFEDHIDDLAEYDDDYPESQEEKHRMLLDFYMNPNYNKYDVV